MSDSVWPHPWDSPGKNTGVGCHFLLQCIKVKSESEVAQSCLTLRYPMDCSLPGSSVHGIFQARVLEWGAIAFSGGSMLTYGYFDPLGCIICSYVGLWYFPGGSAGNNSPASEADAASIPGLGRSAGEGNSNSLQHSCHGNPMDRGAWWATVHGVTKGLDTTEWLNNNERCGLDLKEYIQSVTGISFLVLLFSLFYLFLVDDLYSTVLRGSE